jgi:hypothetical protein
VSTATFAYAQARLQARHAQRPGAADWRLLQGIGDTVHFLQVARRTRLRHWVLGIQGEHDSHRVELLLRRQFQDYADEVLRWLPPPWDKPSDWFKRLPELPAVQYLLNGAEPPAWMRDDPRLGAFTRGDHRQRLQALQQSDCAPLVSAWQRGETLTGAWFSHWRTLWADDCTRRTGLEQFTLLLQRALQQATADSGSGPAGHDYLSARLTAQFRRYAFQPVACYAHLALTALDLITLRGELLQRMLFPAGRVAS